MISSIFTVSAFEWSQKPVDISESFAENRGNCFNTSVMYREESIVTVAEKGLPIIKLTQQENIGLFNSPLGNSIILFHDNELMSVYSNLDNNIEAFPNKPLETGLPIAKSGNSSWQKKDSEIKGSGFSIIDKERQAFINPAILMKDNTTEISIRIENLVAIDRRDNSFDIYNGAYIEAGKYTLYMKRPEKSMIHESQVSLNGEVKETISYDSLNQNDSYLTVQGNKSYSYKEIYPDNQRMRLADVLLQRGANTIEILLSNHDGSKTHNYYRFNVK